ncbi:MAG: TIM barrel protein [Candidatus Bathyarchaeia archaeon]
MRVRFGPAGLPDEENFKLSVETLLRRAYDACQVDFSNGITFEVARAQEMPPLTEGKDIVFSFHAPYYIQLSKEQGAVRHLAMVEHVAHIAYVFGSRLVVVHPGFLQGRTREDVTRVVVRNLQAAVERLRTRGYGEVALGVENMGNKANFGVLEEVLDIVRRTEGTVPVVDFAHVHAVSDGGLKTREDFAALLDHIRERLGLRRLGVLNGHFSDVRYRRSREVKHLKYGEGDLRVAPLILAACDQRTDLTLISESHEEESNQRILQEIRQALSSYREGPEIGPLPAGNRERRVALYTHLKHSHRLGNRSRCYRSHRVVTGLGDDWRSRDAAFGEDTGPPSAALRPSIAYGCS